MELSDASVHDPLAGGEARSDVRPVETMRNLGASSGRMLAAAGIRSAGQLAALGAVAAYVAVKGAGCKPSLNLLWSIEGALTDRDWRSVSRDERTSLLLQLDDHLQGRR